MTHITIIPPDDAIGRLGKLYRGSEERAGKVFQILQMMSPNPASLEASIGLYKAVMFGPSDVSRARREMMATVVSRANDCFY